MGTAKYIGRVGALAAALGIGIALATTPAVAWAAVAMTRARRTVRTGVGTPSARGGGRGVFAPFAVAERDRRPPDPVLQACRASARATAHGAANGCTTGGSADTAAARASQEPVTAFVPPAPPFGPMIQVDAAGIPAPAYA